MTKDEIILKIARDYLLHDQERTLEDRHQDDLDFVNVHVLGIKEALETAYDAGYKDGMVRGFKEAGGGPCFRY